MTGFSVSSGITLNDVLKGYTYDQDKLRSPRETVAWARERLAVLDRRILLKTMRIDSGRLGLPVFISLCGPDAVALTGTQKQMGKGFTPEQAEASALMELLERYSFFAYMKRPPAIRAARRDLGHPSLEPAQLFLSLHDETTDRVEGAAVLEALPLDWVWARNISAGRDELVPLDWFYLINEYNGPAAGNCLEEAVNQALAEVVERHVASVVDHGRLAPPTLDPASLPAGPARQAWEMFHRQGIVVHLKDFSLDTGIPTVAALAWDPATLGTSEIVFQAGTTTDPEKSVLRALTEVQQMACDFDKPTTYRGTLPKFQSLEEAAYLMEAPATLPLDRLPSLNRPNLKDEIEAQAAALGRIGMSVYAVNVTHPVLQVPAVYVIVPGAHFRARTVDGSVLFHAAKLAAEHPDEEASLAVLGELARLRPDDYSMQFFGGIALERAGRPEEALALFGRALDSRPSDIDRPAVLTHLGVCLKDLGRPGEALERLREAAELDGRQWEIRHLIGVCLFQLARYEEGVEAFMKAIEISPGSGIDYANMGSCFRRLGRLGEAGHMYRMALELDPSLDFARQGLALVAEAERQA